MPRVLITGMSGAGKSTLLAELERRRHLTVDTDYGDWELLGSVWDERRMSALLAENVDVVVCGTVENQGQFYDRFEHVVLLSAPVDVLIRRITARKNNPYGHTGSSRLKSAGTSETSNLIFGEGRLRNWTAAYRWLISLMPLKTSPSRTPSKQAHGQITPLTLT